MNGASTPAGLRDALRGVADGTTFGGLWLPRVVLVVFGLPATVLSTLLVGVPLLYAVCLGWQGVDALERFQRTRDTSDAVESAGLLLRGLRIYVLWYAVVYAIYAVVFAVTLAAYAQGEPAATADAAAQNGSSRSSP